MAAQSVLATASLATCAHADVVLPYGQTRPMVLFCFTVADSGDRKSSADNEAAWPVCKREAALKEEYAEAMKAWRMSYAAWAAEKRKIEGNSKMDFAARKDRLSALGPEPEKPLEPILLSDDVTLEGLVKAWPNLHPTHGIFTTEGGMFTAGHAMNDDNRLRSAAMLSKLWDGKPARRIRALDGVTFLHGRRLVMHLMIQPDAAGVFMLSPVLRDQGLLSRVLVASVASVAGTRIYRDADAKDNAAIAAYGARLLSILEAEPPMELGKRNELAPRELPISPEAKTVWVEFYNHVEVQCGKGGELADITAKAAENAACIAGVLTLVDDLRAKEIGLEAMSNAVALTDWYTGEIYRVQQAGRADPRLLRAKALLDWVQARPQREASISSILQFGPNATRTKAAADETLRILLDHGLVTEVSNRPRVIRAVGDGA